MIIPGAEWLLVAVLSIVVIVLLWALSRASSGGRPPGTASGDVHSDGETEPGRAPRIVPDAVQPRELDALLSVRLIGQPADGSVPVPSSRTPATVVWVDHGDEIIVHLDSVKTAFTEGVVLVSMDLESDETGRQTVVVPFSIGTNVEGGLTLVTEELPRGPAGLIRRWGEAIQEAAYAAMLDLAETHAEERDGRPVGLFVSDGVLRFQARPT